MFQCLELFGPRILGLIWYYKSIALISPDIWIGLFSYVPICTEFVSIKNSNLSFRRWAWFCYSCLSVAALSKSTLCEDWDFKLNRVLQTVCLESPFWVPSPQNKFAMMHTQAFSLADATFFSSLEETTSSYSPGIPTNSFNLIISLFMQSYFLRLTFETSSWASSFHLHFCKPEWVFKLNSQSAHEVVCFQQPNLV